MKEKKIDKRKIECRKRYLNKERTKKSIRGKRQKKNNKNKKYIIQA